MKAFLFPGQGAQFEGMGKDLYENHETARQLFDQANAILGFDITKVMFEGTAEELRQTKITQPAIFLHSVITAKVKMDKEEVPAAVAGHSLGEFSALVVSGAMTFEDALQLVYKRALAMQKSCDETEGTMAAIMTPDIELVERICNEVEAAVVPANYNTPSQLVISGSLEGVAEASRLLTEKGARVIPLTVGGAFHSPLMDSAKQSLQEAIESTPFSTPTCPIYQNVTAKATTSVDEIRTNLINQLTGSVRWSQSIQTMLEDGIEHFVEVGGKGRILLGMVRKINRKAKMEML
ncbi:MAG: Malonyl CoA-acyl carrier protein transacylase (EC [uncultured Aureispira sp.]|uniref:Malonyl CoA-acyl carrier protein transacylase n=1 Tax=uncultured Aureispira sp. TaxID=1331704 RepID=A0A6S6TR77_9BACT|nr:MAG: Malonyl CoA-acyl carrier protein transacylase (EC [uncultured Aureispira sp.]